MALADILKKIMDTARQEVAGLESNHKDLLAQKQAAFDARKQSRQAQATERLEQARAQMQAKMDNLQTVYRDQQLLVSQQGIIHQALEGLEKALQGASDEVYKSLAEKVFASLPVEPGVVLVPPSRLGVAKKVAPAAMEVRADDTLSGGMVVRSKNYEIDATWHHLIFGEYRSALVAVVARKLGFID